MSLFYTPALVLVYANRVTFLNEILDDARPSLLSVSTRTQSRSQ